MVLPSYGCRFKCSGAQFGEGDAKERGSGVLKLGCKESIHWQYPARCVEQFLPWHANALTIGSWAISDIEGWIPTWLRFFPLPLLSSILGSYSFSKWQVGLISQNSWEQGQSHNLKTWHVIIFTLRFSNHLGKTLQLLMDRVDEMSQDIVKYNTYMRNTSKQQQQKHQVGIIEKFDKQNSFLSTMLQESSSKWPKLTLIKHWDIKRVALYHI